MAINKVIFTILFGTVGLAVFSNCEQFCRHCVSARRIDDCLDSVVCGSNERCYTEEVITPTGIVYNSGCLAYDACKTRRPVGKKRDADHLVACARCCLGGARNETNHDCNARLCGLPGTATKGTETLSKCYKCEHAHDLDECNEFTICQENEVCFSETHILALGGNSVNGSAQFYFGCARKDICVAGTKTILRIHDQVVTGKREKKTCKACCGGDFCNTADCGTLLNKLYTLSKSGHLNIDSLTYKP